MAEPCTICFQDDAEGEPFTMAAEKPRLMCRFCKRLYRIRHRAIQFRWVAERDNIPIETIGAWSAMAELLEDRPQ